MWTCPVGIWYISTQSDRQDCRTGALVSQPVRQYCRSEVFGRSTPKCGIAKPTRSLVLVQTSQWFWTDAPGQSKHVFFRSWRASKVNAQFGAPCRSWLKCDCQRKLQSMFCFSSCFPPCSCSQDEVLAFWYHLCTERLPPWKANSCVELFTVFKKFLGPQAATGCKSQVIKGIGKFSRILI